MRVDLYSPLSLYEIANALRCDPPLQNIQISGISLNSNTIREGDLFVAIQGKKTDGHAFALQASAKGATAVLCEKDCPSYSYLMKVPNTVNALGVLANYFCKKQRHKTIAITGSVGKSSTCAFLGTILETEYMVHRTEGNYNNEIGVPMTMLSIKKDTDFLLLEMGMNHIGEIKKLSSYANPDIAMITNIGTAHIGLLGSKEQLIKAKSEIVNGMTNTATLIVPQEEDMLMKIHPQTKTFSSASKKADYFLYFKTPDTALINICGEDEIEFKTSPEETVLNETALRTVAIAHCCSIPTNKIESFLPMCHLPQGRQTILENHGKIIIDDSYNASPESMAAAFRKLSGLQVKGKKMALLGDMLELGSYSKEMHTQIGELFASFNFDYLFALGEFGYQIIEGAKRGGMSEEQILYLDTTNEKEIFAFVKNIFRDGDALLVKASHKIGLNKVVKMLAQEGE